MKFIRVFVVTAFAASVAPASLGNPGAVRQGKHGDIHPKGNSNEAQLLKMTCKSPSPQTTTPSPRTKVSRTFTDNSISRLVATNSTSASRTWTGYSERSKDASAKYALPMPSTAMSPVMWIRPARFPG
jgi:hypothetical protein